MHVRLRDKLILLVQKKCPNYNFTQHPNQRRRFVKGGCGGWVLENRVESNLRIKGRCFFSPYDDHQVIIKFNVNRLFKDNTHISTNMPLHCGEGKIRT